MNFEEYLKSKKIDSPAFRLGEPDVWDSWKAEFDQISPTSFTAQKLYLINPIRRKYQLPFIPEPKPTGNNMSTDIKGPEEKPDQDQTKTQAVKAPVAKPVFRPKPKMN